MNPKILEIGCDEQLPWWRETDRERLLISRRNTGRTREVCVDTGELYAECVLNAMQLRHAGGIIEDCGRVVRLGRKGIPLRDSGCTLKRIADTVGLDR